MIVIDELEIRKCKGIFYQCRQLILDGFRPMTYKYNELVNTPGHTAARDLRVVASKLCLQVLGLRTEVLLGPDLTV